MITQPHVDFHGEHSVFDRDDWKHEVDNGDTQLGYWTWVEHRIVSEDTPFSLTDFPEGHVFVNLDPSFAES